MENEKLLLEANIPKKLWRYCTIENGVIYTPSVEKQVELGIIDEDYKEQIDICPPKTLEERLEEAEQKLAEKDQENKMLKAQVEANASSYEFLESCIMEMAEKVYA